MGFVDCLINNQRKRSNFQLDFRTDLYIGNKHLKSLNLSISDSDIFNEKKTEDREAAAPTESCNEVLVKVCTPTNQTVCSKVCGNATVTKSVVVKNVTLCKNVTREKCEDVPNRKCSVSQYPAKKIVKEEICEVFVKPGKKLVTVFRHCKENHKNEEAS